MSNELTYNGYTFNDHSHIRVSAEMVPDDSQRTVIYHRYKIHVTTVITAESGDTNVGSHFLRIRQLLSKQGQALTINHPGFGPGVTYNGGSPGFGGKNDVAFGPKPRFLAWDPVGATNAVEVVWECEFCVPTCDGAGGVRYSGIMALNYNLSFSIDKMGYTTRHISGYIEIAMTRFGQAIPDTADAYRDAIIVPSPPNYERETSWQISNDKRRADFTIVDAQVRSPNAYPAGVVSIRANHRVGWTRRELASLPNTINATITLAPGQPRGRAWVIFRSMVSDRLGYAFAAGNTVFLEGLEVDEELYDNGISFSLSYKIYVDNPKGSALGEIFSTTGLFQPTYDDWVTWKASLAAVQTYRGLSNLSHNATQDQIVDLCANSFMPELPSTFNPPTAPYTPLTRFCNPKPSPDKSYIRLDSYLETIEENPSSIQVPMAPDDLEKMPFNKNDPQATLGDSVSSVLRWVEGLAPGISFVWMGYLERVGYPVRRPLKLNVGGVTLVRKGASHFRQKFLGTHFCQKVYGASWRQEYVVASRPITIPEVQLDGTEEFS